jgi:hypothetical protein
MSNKVQTNTLGVNILVECENSTTSHHSHLDFDVEIIKVLTEEELMEMVSTLSRNEILEAVKRCLRKKPGYAISAVSSKDDRIKDDDIVQYKITT